MSAQQPSPMQTPDLAGLLRARPKPAAVLEEPEPVVGGSLVERPAEKAGSASGTVRELPSADRRPRGPRPRPATRASASESAPVARPAAHASASAGSAEYAQPISVYVPRSVHAAALAAVEQGRAPSFTALALVAVNRHHASLAGWLPDPGSPGGGLFDVPQARPRLERTTQSAIRVTDAQLDAIDGLAKELGVPRTQVVVAALRAELDLKP